MKFRFIYTRRAERDILSLAPQVRERIGKALSRFTDNPLAHAERLTDASVGGYRFRVGDYRVIFDLEGKNVVVLRVGHRREIYRRR